MKKTTYTICENGFAGDYMRKYAPHTLSAVKRAASRGQVHASDVVNAGTITDATVVDVLPEESK